MKQVDKQTVFIILKYLASFFFAAIIIYFLFRNQDPVKLVNKISEVELEWVVLSMIFGAWAYVNRGLRWIVLIDALGYTSSKTNSILSVSIGYFTNLFIPRAGEISRCTVLNKFEKIPVDKLFGTILIERVIDFLFLIILFLFALVIKFDLIVQFFNELESHRSESPSISGFGIFFAILTLTALLIVLFKQRLRRLTFYDKVSKFISGLKEGFVSINKMKRKSLFWMHTFSIWTMYFLMTYICFYAIPETSDLTISDGLFLLVLGGIGMVIPTPGGIGSYHAIVMIGLAVLGVGFIDLHSESSDYNAALIFPTIVHVAQTLVAIIMGSAGFLILFLSKKKVKNE